MAIYCLREAIDMTKVRNTALRIAALTAVLILAVSMISAPRSEAKSKARLSAKKISLTVGKSRKIKLTGTSKKARWTVTNKKIVTLKAKGKGKRTAVIKAGKNLGTCYVKVKFGKKTLKCRVTVYKTAKWPPEDPEPPFEEKPLSVFSTDLTEDLTRGAFSMREADDEFTSGYAGTSLAMLKLLTEAEPDRNVLISPDSIFTAMTMAENGASGETLSEMEASFGEIPLDKYREYLATLNSRLIKSEKIKYHIADSVWYKENDIHIRPEFLQNNVDYFGAEVYSSPFDENTVSDVNNWVYNNTRGMIPDIIKDLSKDASLLLINAIAFEGNWSEPYEDTQVKKEPFLNEDGTVQKTVNMLHGSESTHVKVGGADGFVKYYEGGDIAFLGLETPEGKTVDEFVDNLSGSDFITGYRNRSREYPVVTRMPEFKYDYDASLVNTLKALGIQQAFNEDLADFSGITQYPLERLFISDVIHKTHIELDRNGTKAAAATAVVMEKASSAPSQKVIEVNLDHPFVYAIIDTDTGLPLFIGTVKTL